jgi:hypothetical protein
VGIVGANVAAGLIGNQQSQAALSAAQAARQAALQQYLNINVPDPAEQQVILEQYKLTGKLAPEMEQAVDQKASELQNMQVPTEGRSAEIEALNQMQDLAHSGGMDAQARESMEQGIQRANANMRGQIGAIVQNANARGVGGSGAELAAQLQATQNDANASSEAGMSAASAAELRALQAMSSAGSLGSTLNQQDYNQAAAKAQAQDAINRFNTQNRQSVSNANVAATNQAEAANLANEQAVSNANVGIQNQQEVQNKGLVQQEFNNEMALAGGKANAENGVATGYQNQAQNSANTWANIGNAVGQGVAAIAKNSSGPNTRNSGSSDSPSVSDNSDDYSSNWV